MIRLPIALFLTSLVMLGCSSLLGLQDNDDDPLRSESAVERQARIERDLRVEGAHQIVDVYGVPYLATTITATNAGSLPIEGIGGIWLWYSRAYTDSGRTGAPVWKVEEYLQDKGVPDLARTFSIAPGQSVAFTGVPGAPIADILKGAPPGRYYFTVVLELIDPRLRTGEFNAGEADLP
jgi:hypothetical protein